MIGLIKRFAFFMTKAIALLAGGVWGALGGNAVVASLFGSRALHSSIHEMGISVAIAIAVILTFSVVVGASGFMALIVLPLHFLLPKLREPFSWEAKGRLDSVLYAWYGRKLVELSEEMNRRNNSI